jgi:hypothetical protein
MASLVRTCVAPSPKPHPRRAEAVASRKRRGGTGPVPGQRSRRGLPGDRRPARPTDTDEAVAGDAPLSADGDRLVAHWQSSRAGARAGRGFHFQDAVGAWLAAQVANGALRDTALVPEGLEDLWLEGSTSNHIQVKSRVNHRGPFPVVEASGHILDAWSRHATRSADGDLTVVLEGGVEGEAHLEPPGKALREAVAVDSALGEALGRVAVRRGISSDELDRATATTAIVGASWESITAETVARLGALAELPPTALLYLARELRVMVADAADANATAAFNERSRLDRTRLTAAIQQFVEHVDIDTLQAAIVDGICEPLDLAQPAKASDRFYEGLSTQPGHVAAGLVVPRPQIVAEVLSGLEHQSAAVLTGPSGVGKSAVLWMVPLALPGVLWFRVRRLSEGDASALIRLARAYRASADTPVGFLVDAAGTGDFRGWARLRAEASAVPGILLVGTARQEDLMALGDLSGCATVGVDLDESAAEVIFEGLARRGATTTPHWREAFEKSRGLTMEFAHLLTRGRRLDDVISEQIRVRVQEQRWREMQLLSLVSTADRWSAGVPVARATEECDASQLELRQALSRLAEEHLVVERDGVLNGLHPLRSAAISRAVHAQPPPALSDTITAVLRAVPAAQLHRFIANALRDEPELAASVIDAACTQPLDFEQTIGFLHGLRLADFYNLARTWRAIAENFDVPANAQSFLFLSAAADVTLGDIFPAQFESARQEMVAASGTSHRDTLVERLRVERLAGLLASRTNPGDAARLLSTLHGFGERLAHHGSGLLNAQTALVKLLATCSVDDLGTCLAAAHSCGGDLASLLSDRIGGEAATVRRLREQDPWITDLDVRTQDGALIGYGRLLHVSDDLQGDPQERALALSRLLLRCLPRVERVDVQTLLAGRQELRIGDLTHGVTELRREYDRPALDVAWVQARIRAAHTLLGQSDTERLAAALPLLEEASYLTRAIGNALVSGTHGRTAPAEIDGRVAELHRQAVSLRPSLGSAELGETGLADEPGLPMGDDLSALITDLTGNVYSRLSKPETYRAVTAYLSDTVIAKHLGSVFREPWHLLGINGHPVALDELAKVLRDLQAVVQELSHEDADKTKIGRSARSGTHSRALNRAAEASRRAARRRTQLRHEEIKSTIRATGLRTQVFMPGSRADVEASDIAITVELPSLLEWPDALARLETALADRRSSDTFLIVPLRHARPVAVLAARIITSTWPSPDLGAWASALNDPQPTVIAQTFERAHAALQAVSGIGSLPRAQQDHPDVREAAETAAAEFRTARDDLLARPSDPIIDGLVEILDDHGQRIQTELHGAAEGPTLAEDVIAAALQGAHNEAFNALAAARMFALEWDIDPARAVQLLAEAS